MRVVDLSHKISESMTTYTKDERPKIYKIATIEKDGYNEKKLNICTHIGTHIDAPSHMIQKGKNIDEYSVENFIGLALIIDVSNLDKITIKDLLPYENAINNCDFVILKTGWYKHWNQEEYFYNYPSLTENAAKWLCEFSIRGIGTDTVSIDTFDSIEFEIHNTILSRGRLIIENLNNLDSINSEIFTLVATPLKIQEGDASPVRAVALEE
jgi:arylformamidase